MVLKLNLPGPFSVIGKIESEVETEQITVGTRLPGRQQQPQVSCLHMTFLTRNQES